MFAATFALALVVAHVGAEIPSYIQVCGRRNPNLDKCILDSVLAIRGKLCEGMPELDVPPIDPMILDTINISLTAETKIQLKDPVLVGVCDFQLNSLHVDLSNYHFDVDITFKRILINATYIIDTRILVPIALKVPVSSTADNILAKAGIDMKLVTKDGKQYLYISKIKLNLDIKGYKSQFFLEDTELKQFQEVIRDFMGNNQQEIIATLKSPLEKVVSEHILKISNAIVTHFTYDELLPDRA